ncbi:hypothetical protein [Eubacterium sp.]|uniref:hypothetical protein n=1 Tax=Eubacterium sp. TaxID=142586 RepID=UPI0025BF3308|nr:hypothetical protein [Eubacterium sp.]
MKKIFKKSLACLIAVLMIVSSLPFATLTANAATTTSTATVSAYGIIKGSDQGRFTDPKLTICNDAQDGNFTIGFVNFDVSNVSCTDLDEVSASYNFTSAMATGCSENMGLTVWYPTANYTDFDQSTGEYKLSTINSDSSSAVFKGDNSGHIGNTTSHYSMKKLSDFTTNGSSHTVNIGNAIKFAKVNGRSVATICFMITSAGGIADRNSSWTDTIVTINNKTVAVNVEQNSSSLPTAVLKFEKDMKAMAAGTVMYKNVNTAYNAYVNYFNVRKSLCEGNGGDLAAALTTLTNAVATMEASTFTAPTGNFIDKLGSTKIFVDADNSSTDEYKQIYKNVLYSETGMTDAGTAAGTAKNVNFTSGESGFTTDNKVVIPEATVLYNGGDTPQVGAMYALWGNSKPNLIYNWNNLRVFAVYVSNTSDVQFAGKWKGLDGRLNMTWVWLTQSERNISGTGDTTSGYYNQGTRDEKFYANLLQVKKTFGESDPLLTEYTPNFDVRVGQDKANAKDTLTGSKVIRVINYNYVIGKIKSAEAKYYGNIAKYRQGGLSTVISTLDEVMAKNPNDYFAVGTNNYSGLVSFYNTKFNTVNSSNPTVDTAVNHADSSYDWTVTKAATCTTAGSKTGVCKYCGETTVREIPATGHEYTYTYVDKTHHTKKCTKGDFEEQEEHTLGTDGKCTVCKGTVIDYTAYDAAVDVAGAIMMHMTEYTDESYAEFYKIVTGATAKKGDVKTQAELDALTDIIVSAQTVLRKKIVTVTLQKVGANDTPTTIKTYENQEYGTALEIDLATEDSSIKGVEKWTISTDDGATTTKLSTTDTKLTLYVTKSATVTVYELDEPNDSETVKYSKVVFLGKNGVIVDIKYVKQDDTKTPAQLGVTVPTVPFYTSNGWDNESITGTGKTIYVRAKYTASTKKEDMCNVHFGEWSREYSYDSFVRPDGIDPSKQYALASDAEGKNILTYLEGVDFYAPKTSDIYVVEVKERVAKTGITGHFAGSDDTHRWATYNCKFYLPKDCTAIEWGLEVKYGANTKIMKAERISNGNEYTVIVRVKQASTITNVTCRSYVTYKQNGETKTNTIYSDVAVEQAF